MTDQASDQTIKAAMRLSLTLVGRTADGCHLSTTVPIDTGPMATLSEIIIADKETGTMICRLSLAPIPDYDYDSGEDEEEQED